MIESIAYLYAEKALNDKLFAEGMISQDVYRIANEGITLDIDNITKKACVNNVISYRSMSDGIIKRSSPSG